MDGPNVNKKFYEDFSKETQTFKAYYTESYKYCIIIAGSNTKILKTHGYLTKSCSLLALLSVYCDLCFLLPSSMAEFFHFSNTALCEF